MSVVEPTPAASRTIDLDAARAARAGARSEPVTVIVDGVTYSLPAELPVDVVTGFGLAMRGDVGGIFDALESLFGEKAWAKIKVGMAWDDAEFLLTETTKLYGFTLPG